MTVLVVGMWERRKQRVYDLEDNELEKGPKDMEKAIMAAMRKRTQTTWDIGNEG